MIPAPSCFGKLPSYGDFIRVRVNKEQRDRLDAWFSTLPKSNANQTDSEVQALSSKGAWCFAIRGELLASSKHLMAIGVMKDSFDKVGRRYPFVMYQLVPKKWLAVQLQHPQNWLQCLYQFAELLDGKETADIDQKLNELWAVYKPALLDYFKSIHPTERDRKAHQARRIWSQWSKPDRVISDQIGVTLPPYTHWSQHVTKFNKGSIWWQLDSVNRYVDCVESQQLDKSLLTQLITRPEYV